MSSRVVLLFNPASGRGKAGPFARTLAETLTLDGWDVDHKVVGEPGSDTGFDGARSIVVIGGDGTVHHAAPLIHKSGIPMVIAPMGTENLLARELGHRATISAVRKAVQQRRVAHIDLPTVNDIPFLVMCSIGLDAAIVAAVDANRKGSIRKLDYIKPMLQQAMKPILPALRVTVDGERICDAQRGMLVIANCRKYGARLNPAKHASMIDGLLDVAFYPMRRSLDAVRWAVLSRIGRHDRSRGFIHARGRLIQVENPSSEPAPVQIDGEPASVSGVLPLRFISDSHRIAVLGL